MPPALSLIPADEARRILLETPPLPVETVSLAEAAGRVLASPLVAPHDLPAERRSAMDGYAVRAADVAGAPGAVLRVVGTVSAGGIFADEVEPGAAVAIATGSVVPDGADAVVMVEHTTPVEGGARVEVRKAVARGANVNQPGEDFHAGDPVLAMGRRLRSVDVSALAMFGVVRVPVFRRPRIAVITTGSEICPTGDTPRPGQVRDVNEHVLGAQVEAAGGIATRAGIVPDDVGRLREAVGRLVAEHDGLILSGGSSIGTKDLTGEVLAELPPPGVLFHGIDIRPGKPTVFARAGGKPVVGMPGYPTSAMVVFEAFVRPLLARIGGETVADAWPTPVRARLAATYAKPAAREDYLRVRLTARDGDLWAEVVPGGSAAISNIIFADGLVRVPAGVERLDAGAIVGVRSF